MSDAMHCAEFDEQHVELLPARTVLSLLHPADPITGSGEPGTKGADGQGMHGFNLLGWVGWNGSQTSASSTPDGQA